MKQYKVISCYNCGEYQYVEEGNKTRKCPKCNKVINLSKVLIHYRTDDITYAVSIVQHLKIKNKNIDKKHSSFKNYNIK